MSDNAEGSATTPSRNQPDRAEQREEEGVSAGQYQEIAHETTKVDNRVNALYCRAV